MKPAFDWKFIFTIVIAIAIGLLTPYLQGIYDSQAKSLRVNLVDSIGLDPPGAKLVPGLQVTLNGELISSPVVTVLELENDGSKPILTSEFEGPIQLSIENEAKLIEARVAGASQRSLTTSLEFDSKTVRLQPLLLNPKDNIVLTLLTSGDIPMFVPQARIAGVSSIKLELMDNNPKRTKSGWIMYAIGIVCYIGCAFVLGVPTRRTARFTWGAQILQLIFLSIPASILTAVASNLLDPDGKHQWAYLGVPVMLCVVLSVLWRKYFWQKRIIETSAT